jgi:hypothetical protein
MIMLLFRSEYFVLQSYAKYRDAESTIFCFVLDCKILEYNIKNRKILVTKDKGKILT